MTIKKAALISGGGSWGAYGGGTLAKINGDYNMVVGVSTGSLLAPFTALREWELLKHAYTNVNNNNIFDYCWYKSKPLTKDGKIKILPIVMTLLLGHNSICTSHALRKTIDKFFPENLFNELQKQDKEILVGTQNFSQVPSKVHYFSSNEEEFEEFKDWMWCSANFPYYTSLVKKGWRDAAGNFHVGHWSDGGLTDLVGINQLIGKGYKEIDIILHRTKVVNALEGNKIKNFVENISTGINVMRYDIEFEHFYDKITELNKQGSKVTVYWLPRKLSNNSMLFNKKEMLEWWDEGFDTAFDPQRIEVFSPISKKL
jgi:NTE family protein